MNNKYTGIPFLGVILRVDCGLKLGALKEYLEDST